MIATSCFVSQQTCVDRVAQAVDGEEVDFLDPRGHVVRDARVLVIELDHVARINQCLLFLFLCKKFIEK